MLLQDETNEVSLNGEVELQNDIQHNNEIADSDYLKGNRHISEEQIAVYVDMVMANRHYDIPSDISTHIDNCLQCKTDMLKLKYYYEH